MNQLRNIICIEQAKKYGRYTITFSLTHMHHGILKLAPMRKIVQHASSEHVRMRTLGVLLCVVCGSLSVKCCKKIFRYIKGVQNSNVVFTYFELVIILMNFRICVRVSV